MVYINFTAQMQQNPDRAQKLIIMVTPTPLKKKSQIFALPYKIYLKFSFCANLNLFCDFYFNYFSTLPRFRLWPSLKTY